MILKAVDGFYHPTDEADLIDLINAARAARVHLRVRSAAHSLSYAVYTNPAKTGRNVVSKQR